MALTEAWTPDHATDPTDGGLTASVARWCEDVRLESIPQEAVTVLHHCVLDWLGVTLAGCADPLVDILTAEVGRAEGACTVLGRTERAAPADAALVNGSAAHALDFDDTHMALPGHPTTPVLSGLLAVAEQRHLPGEALLRALLCGIEVELRLGRMAQPHHYETGWHATATLGSIGAAVACAEALGATVEQRRAAIGIAVSHASGLKSMFGTMCKPVQVGRAAANGVFAARLAQRGMTSNPAALEDPQGFFAAYGGPPGAGSRPWPDDRLELVDNLFKYHASCYFTHAAIEAAGRLREQETPAEDVDRIRVWVNPANRSVCDIPQPETGLEGKFSLRATVALALLGHDTGDPGTFTDDAMIEGRLVEMRERVVVESDPELARTQVRVQVERRDGEARTAVHDSGRPERDLDRQGVRLEDKVRRLATPVLGEEKVGTALGMVRHLHELHDAADLAAALAPTAPRTASAPVRS
ncbi:MAG: MmgE/PrpD family protein [Nitriliruptorales bacterium]|nr:MmgE/PrpD family protein [Nitriliruptorales bacterium]